MFSYELIEAYMKAKNYSQAKQAAADLGFSNSFITKLKTGEKKIADDSAIYIAERCGMDVSEILIKLQAEKAKSDAERNAWTSMLKKYKHGITPVLFILFSGLLNQPSNEMTSHNAELCRKLVFLMDFLIIKLFGAFNEKSANTT